MTENINLPELPSLYEKTGSIADINTLLVNQVQLVDLLRAAVLADRAQRQAVPQGWKLVPLEPTDDMVKAWSQAGPMGNGMTAEKLATMSDDECNRLAATSDYKAMLSASPTPPASEPVREPFKLNPPPIYDEHYAATQDVEPVQAQDTDGGKEKR